ncbi:aromatic ring-hydroxylating dioxygenase subunit alpha [Asticcacaulis sp. ZE23SCel15]|uniref:aromatic ring-hydroxylating oxygenase subunit alpha n=1 Tax=Asticcacaulis sp. ZE23SCel15 TaxID=3059027 RepID=UPI00265F56A7|nr:aromatic ring-hydroxylating dioxygenase subunit alpha [Asticcacaulis sp. ZE23SCel15]WKL57411.1 aromatic ring-hydroxylating dioxygenase subunit alpha [Asticcacaulis sp. ZE23SCel15]
MPDQAAPSEISSSANTPRERMVFGQGFLKDCWYFAALSSELVSGKLQRYVLLDEPVLLGRDLNGAVYAMRDICPHRAAPLSAGQMIKDESGACIVQCPYHGWTFNTAGTCTKIPSLTSDQEMNASKIRVRNYAVTEQQGLVWVYVTSDPRRPPEPDHAPPTLPGVVGGKPIIVERMDFDSHIDHAVVGLMDPAHGPYVHQQWWWRSSKKQLEKSKAFAPTEYGFAMVRHAPSKNSRAYRILGGAPATEITFRLPGVRYEHIVIGERQILGLTCLTPIDAKTTRITQIFWSDHSIFRAITPFFRLGAKAFLKQDGDMVNLQNEGLKYDPSLLWIDDADTQAKWYQQLKREWVQSRADKRAFVNPVKPSTLKWTS